MYTELQKENSDDTLAEYAPLVKRIAYHLMGRLPDCVQVEDLIQAGLIGLLEALKHFDPSQGASFETYAGIRVRGAMLDEIRSGDWTPRSVHRKLREVTEAVRRVENRKQGDARDAEVAAEMGISVDEYHQILKDATSAKLFSVDDTDIDIDSQHNHSWDDTPHTAIQQDHFKAALAESIEGLPEREQLVMSLYYDDEMNLREIGAVLGVSESRVCQIHGQALIRVRARLGDWIDGSV